MLYGIQTKFVVPDKYTTPGLTTSTTFTVPMFDYGYRIDYSYSDIAYTAESASGQLFPNYSLAKKLVLISKYSFTWSGLTESEKDTFLAFIKSFNNSFQPFTLQVYTTVAAHTDYYMIINADTLSISKDKFDLWSISLTVIQL